MKTLVAIESCHGREAYLQACHATWVPMVSLKPDSKKIWVEDPDFVVKAFAGLARGPQTNIYVDVILPVDDSYPYLPYKTVAIAQWALQNGFEHLWICDDDAYLQPRFLYNERSHDYWGTDMGSYCWGASYGLSLKAMKIVASSEPRKGCEDNLVGEWLDKAGIHPTNVERCRRVPKKLGGHTAYNPVALPEDFLSLAELTPRMMHHIHGMAMSQMFTGEGQTVIPRRFTTPPELCWGDKS